MERARAEKAERALAEAQQAHRDAIERLLKLGLTTEQVAQALSLSTEQVRHLNS
ncbi:MAG: hypothetical protein AB4426_06750 [Xenococcaceae cyanobacterium]